MLSDRCLKVCPVLSVLSVLSVTLVYCGPTVGRTKTKLGTQVGLGPGHIVLDGDQVPLPHSDTAPNFWPCLLWPNGCMDQDATWYGGRPRPWPHCARCGPSSPSAEKGVYTVKPPNFRPSLFCPNRCMDQHATWYGGGSTQATLC